MKKLDKKKRLLKFQNRGVIKGEVDPRSKTTADGAFNYIATGKPGRCQLEVTKRMLAEKKKKLK